jgi:3-hydroxyisobutyrate dehydrogenase-like beta-hydroxyacid dehydrogenase
LGTFADNTISQDTIDRAHQAGAQLVSDDELVQQCNVVLSVVPPSQAEATAQRIIDALSAVKREGPLYFADLNAISPSSARAVAAMFEKATSSVRFIDGCILGGPPKPKSDADRGATNVTENADGTGDWSCPRIPVSGPHSLDTLPGGAALASLLNMRVISPEIGPASGLKMCFAALSKGFTALATQSFTTAHRLGVAEDLALEMGQILPRHLDLARKGVPTMPPKAYRWVREMEEIAATMRDDGGWSGELFGGVADVYRAVAEDEVLGQERIGKRKRGTCVEDVAAALAEGMDRKRKKED